MLSERTCKDLLDEIKHNQFKKFNTVEISCLEREIIDVQSRIDEIKLKAETSDVTESSSAGPFTDVVCKKNTGESNMMILSKGIHIVINPGFVTDNMGMLETRASDNRVIFILPWCNHTIIGSTEDEARPTILEKPTEEQVNSLFDEL